MSAQLVSPPVLTTLPTKPRLCAGCEQPIPPARLKAMPSATHCVPCLQEKGDVPLLRRFDETSRHGTVETLFIADSRVARQLDRQYHTVPGQQIEEREFDEETTPGLSLTDVIEDEAE